MTRKPERFLLCGKSYSELKTQGRERKTGKNPGAAATLYLTIQHAFQLLLDIKFLLILDKGNRGNLGNSMPSLTLMQQNRDIFQS
jgi:hypothetical protein